VVYVGIDLHRRASQVAVFDEEGMEILSRRVTNHREALRAVFAELGGGARVALETACGWEWLADLLEGRGIELHLAPPRQTKAIAAARARSPTSSAPTSSPRPTSPRASCASSGSWCATHIALTRLRTALTNRVHALLAPQGVQHGRAELFGPEGRSFLGELPLPAPTRRRPKSPP
jgi:transposase